MTFAVANNMIPFTLNEKQFSARYKRELDRLSPLAIELFRALLKRSIDPDVQYADAEIFLDEYGGAPSIWIYYVGENNRVDQVSDALFAGRSLELQIPFEALAKFDERYFAPSDEGELQFPGLTLAGDLCKAWVAECWWKSGGWDYAVPSSLAVHDGWGGGNVIQLTAKSR